MLYNRCTDIYNFGNDTKPGRKGRRYNLGYNLGKKVHITGREIGYIEMIESLVLKKKIFTLSTKN
jgi:hypothetical protein